MGFSDLNPHEQALVTALRSGKYSQATSELRVGDSFCCLGVACDLYNPEGWSNKDGGWSYRDNRTINTGVLPDSVQTQLNWLTPNGQLRINEQKSPDLYTCLSQLNDQGFTFNQIADSSEAGLVLHKGEEPPNGLNCGSKVTSLL